MKLRDKKQVLSRETSFLGTLAHGCERAAVSPWVCVFVYTCRGVLVWIGLDVYTKLLLLMLQHKPQ
jgi:hypothetical protein